MKHTTKPRLQAMCLLIASSASTSLLAAVEVDLYGSARIQFESVNPDSNTHYANGGHASYIDLRDAYSRIGLNIGWQATEQITVFGQVEMPFDIANFKVQDPYKNTRELRVAQVGLDTHYGTLAYGQMWLPFYNAISYKVDRFSSYYSGYATLAYFRAFNAVSYYSPTYNGFSFGAGLIMRDHSDRADGRPNNHYQFTTTYKNNKTDLSFAIDQQDDKGETRLIGAALGQQIDRVYFALKLEQASSKATTDLNVINLYVDYQLNQYTFKGMVAKVDGFGDHILHFGADYQYSKNLKTFVEFYQQEKLNAIANRKRGGAGTPDFIGTLNGGGNAVAVGLRYDF
ncbi:MAG: porin [Thiomicrospira sp.]